MKTVYGVQEFRPMNPYWPPYWAGDSLKEAQDMLEEIITYNTERETLSIVSREVTEKEYIEMFSYLENLHILDDGY